MKAVIETRCGCTREIECEYPPLRQLRIPLIPDIDMNTSSELPIVKVRAFDLVQFENLGPAQSTAKYYEHMTAFEIAGGSETPK